MKSISIRPASTDDAAAIAVIYNEGIEDRVATLETEPRTVEDRRQWLLARTDRTPVIVADLDGAVAGWASINQFNPRPAYRFVADFSVYIGRHVRGSGVGSLLLEHLIATARTIGYHKLVLAAFPFNEAGMRLYKRYGFQEVGIFHEQGVLDGAWVDTIVMELLLDDDPPPLNG